MKNPNAWVLGINLIVYGLSYLLYPSLFFQYFWVLIAINVLAGFVLLKQAKRTLAYAFFLAALVVPLIGLGVCAIIMSQIRIGGSH